MSETLTVADIQWRDRYVEVTADRDYWRSRAESWESRYVEAAKQVASLAAQVVTQPVEPESDAFPPALEVALKRYAAGQSADVVRTMRREMLDTYANANGGEDKKQLAALDRLASGDGVRVAAFLGESD